MSKWNVRGGGPGGEPKGKDPHPPAGVEADRAETPEWADQQVMGGHRESLPRLDGVSRLPEGAQARRAGWTQLLPPSLGLEIQAIWQVRLAPLKHPSPLPATAPTQP